MPTVSGMNRMQWRTTAGAIVPAFIGLFLLTAARVRAQTPARELKPDEAFGQIQQYFSYVQNARHAREPIWSAAPSAVEVRVRTLLQARGATPAEVRQNLTPGDIDFGLSWVEDEKALYDGAASAFLGFFSAGIDSGRVHLLSTDLSVLDDEMKVFRFYQDLLQKRWTGALETTALAITYDILYAIRNERYKAREYSDFALPDILKRGGVVEGEFPGLDRELWLLAPGYSQTYREQRPRNHSVELKGLRYLFDGFARLLEDPRLQEAEVRPASTKRRGDPVSLEQAAEQIETHKVALNELLGAFAAKDAEGIPYNLRGSDGYLVFLRSHIEALDVSLENLLQRSFATRQDLDYLSRGMGRLKQEWVRVGPVMQALAGRFHEPDPLWIEADRIRERARALVAEMNRLKEKGDNHWLDLENEANEVLETRDRKRDEAHRLQEVICRPAKELGEEFSTLEVFHAIPIGGKIIEIRFHIAGVASKIPLTSVAALSELPVGVPLIAEVVYDAPMSEPSCTVEIRIGSKPLHLEANGGAGQDICSAGPFVLWPTYSSKPPGTAPPR